MFASIPDFINFFTEEEIQEVTSVNLFLFHFNWKFLKEPD